MRKTIRRGDGFKVLRKALAYGWSVAVAAAPVGWLARLKTKKDRPQTDGRSLGCPLVRSLTTKPPSRHNTPIS